MGEVQTVSKPEPASVPPEPADGKPAESPVERLNDVVAASLAAMAPDRADEPTPHEPPTLPRYLPADYWGAASRELMRFSSYRMSRNLRALDRFVTCRSGNDVVNAASAAANGTLEDYASEFNRLVDLGREALSPASRA